MSSIAGTTVVQGPAYILKVKTTRDWGSDDLVYAVVNRGSSKFNFNNFKSLSETFNNLLSITFKIDNGVRTTWETCQDEMMATPAKGSPRLLVDRPYSFGELGTILCEVGIFPSPVGLQYLTRRTTPSKVVEPAAPATLPSVQAVQSKPRELRKASLSRELVRKESMMKDVRKQSESISLLKASMVTSGLAQGARQMIGLPFVETPEVGINVVVGEENDEEQVVVEHGLEGSDAGIEEERGTEQGEILTLVGQEEIEAMKEKVVVAVSKVETLEIANDALTNTVNVLRAQLKSSDESSAKFMAQADKLTAAMPLTM